VFSGSSERQSCAGDCAEELGERLRRRPGRKARAERRGEPGARHHTRQRFALTIAEPGLQEKAFSNSGMFDHEAVHAVLARRMRVGERLHAQVLGRSFSHAHCA
jgi:hypothetical protein